jgi:hypothetical protein
VIVWGAGIFGLNVNVASTPVLPATRLAGAMLKVTDVTCWAPPFREPNKSVAIMIVCIFKILFIMPLRLF